MDLFTWSLLTVAAVGFALLLWPRRRDSVIGQQLSRRAPGADSEDRS